MNKIAHLFLLALTIAIMTMLAAIAWSQPGNIPSSIGSIAVTIIDSATNKPIIGSTCRLVGTTQGAITKSNGTAIIKNVRTGTYSVAITAGGYRTDTLRNIIVEAGKAVIVQSVLKVKPQLDQLVSILPVNPVIEPTPRKVARLRYPINSSDDIDTTSRVYRAYYKQ